MFSAATPALIVDVQNALAGNDISFPQWNGPGSTIVHVQAILHSSLAASLLAVLGKQWFNVGVIDRSRHQERKVVGMTTWHFDLVLKYLHAPRRSPPPVHALSNFHYFIDKLAASVAIGFTTSSPPFYLSPRRFRCCPIIQPYILNPALIRRQTRSRKLFGRVFSQKKQPRLKSGGPYSLGRFGSFDGSNFGGHIELPMTGAPNRPPPLFN